MSYGIRAISTNKRMNSTAVPSGGAEINGVTLKGGCSVLRPTFRLNINDFSYNQVYWNSRYYWVDEVEWERDNLVNVTCSVDPLASWRTSILNTRAYVNYSASSFNPYLQDGRLMVKSETTIVSESANIGSQFNTTGTYILGVIGKPNSIGTGGFTTVYQMTARDCADLANYFCDPDSVDMQKVTEQFGNAFGCLVYCKWIPVAMQGFGLSQIYLGTQGSGVFGQQINERLLFGTVFIPIPWFSEDFRQSEPFSHASLYLPFVGVVDLSLQDLTEIVTLTVTWAFDLFTGEIVYSIINKDGILAIYRGDAFVDIPLSSYQRNLAGAYSSTINGMVNTAGSLLSGNALGAVTNAVGTFANAGLQYATMNPGIKGGFSGAAGSRLSLDLKLSVITHDTSQNPSDMASVQGRPLGRTVTMSSLNGYVECASFKVAGPMTRQEKEMIESYMTGGAYLE